METVMLRRLALLIALAASGCAVNPARLAPGTSADEVRRQLGEATSVYRLADGGQRLEYASGPFGKQTWMLDFDAGGRLLAASQVLTAQRFNTIRAGMSRDELRLSLGRPSETSLIGWQRQTVWSYRYDSPFCQWFQVGIDTAGRVVDTGYYPDPLCEDKQMISFRLPRR